MALTHLNVPFVLTCQLWVIQTTHYQKHFGNNWVREWTTRVSQVISRGSKAPWIRTVPCLWFLLQNLFNQQCHLSYLNDQRKWTDQNLRKCWGCISPHHWIACGYVVRQIHPPVNDGIGRTDPAWRKPKLCNVLKPSVTDWSTVKIDAKILTWGRWKCSC